MKKLLLLALAMVLCFSLVACGKEEEKPVVDSQESEEVVTPVEEPETIIEPEVEEVSGEEISGEEVLEVSGEVEE